MKYWCELAERYPDIHYIFDTKMATFHQQLKLLCQEDYSGLWKKGHIRHFHVNDYADVERGRLPSAPLTLSHLPFLPNRSGLQPMPPPNPEKPQTLTPIAPSLYWENIAFPRIESYMLFPDDEPF